MDKLFFKNPELRKNLWLELSFNRLLATPLILAGIYFLVFLMSDNTTDFLQNVEVWSISMYALFIFIYGTRLSSESIIEEVNERTWDNQRMTSVSPWMMSVGKLFGSTVFAWYGALICILVYFVASFFLPISLERFKFGIILIFIAVFTHSVSISLSLVGIRKNRNQAKIKSTFYFIGALILSGYLIYYAFLILEDYQKDLSWYIFKMSIPDFGIFTILFFSFWGLISLNRNMRTEFQYRNGIDVWVAFLVSSMIYIAGLSVNAGESFSVHLALSLGCSYVLMIVITYFMAFSEPKYVVDFRLLMKNWREGNWKELQYNAPLWLVTLVFVVSICPVLIVLFFFLDMKEDDFNDNKITFLYPFSILCFVLRDLCMLLYLNLSAKSRRADLATFLYLLVLYILIPSIVKALDSDAWLAAFLPVPLENVFYSMVPVLCQFLIMAYLLYRRFTQEKILVQ